jgi:hypothetical protein
VCSSTSSHAFLRGMQGVGSRLRRSESLAGNFTSQHSCLDAVRCFYRESSPEVLLIGNRAHVWPRLGRPSVTSSRSRRFLPQSLLRLFGRAICSNGCPSASRRSRELCAARVIPFRPSVRAFTAYGRSRLAAALRGVGLDRAQAKTTQRTKLKYAKPTQDCQPAETGEKRVSDARR